MASGKIKFYNAEKKFGFIEIPEQENDMFFHVTGCVSGYQPVKDQAVTFDIVDGNKGPMASNIELMIEAS